MAASNLKPQRAGTIRRVVRRGNDFICGLCRSLYDGEAAAQGCVKRCWAELKAMDPVIERRHGLHQAFRCRFCAREFAARRQAAKCAADCLSNLNLAFDREQDLSDSLGAPPARRPRPRPMLRAVPAGRRPAPKSSAKGAASAAAGSAPASAPISVDVGTPPDEAAAAAAVAAAAKAAKEKAAGAAGAADAGSKEAHLKKLGNGGETFYRDGARYVCRACNTKHFTRDAVEACFKSHADAPAPA